jgi:type II secretory pathway component GspD/PulD (secretin)
MKTTSTLLLAAGLIAIMPVLAAEPSSQLARPGDPPAQPATNAPAPAAPAAPVALPAPENPTNAATLAATNTPPVGEAGATNAAPLAATNAASVAEAGVTNAAALASTNAPSDGLLRLNFRGVPLDMVLNYLSEAAGFIIVLDTDVRGRVDVWSNQPVTKDEAVSLLNSVLKKNGYAAVRNDRTLTIVPGDSIKTRDIPVKKGNEPNEIPKNDEIVTQILPVRYINATQLTKDLTPLLPMSATMTANESGNSLVITDTQASIRRMAEIVKALDTSISSVSQIRVYPLKFADAKTVATVIKDLFQQQDSGQRSGQGLAAQFFQRMRGGGGGGGGPFGGGGDMGGGGGGGSGGRVPTPKVLATSDDRSNSLVVSAPDDMISTIDELVKAIDTNVEDVTEVRVFKLKFADPTEMADLLAGLFPDDTRNDTGNRGSVRFGGGMFGGGAFGGGRGQGNAAAGQQSDRMKKMGKVIAVPDQRTASVVVSASRDLMTQIEQMITQLDSNPAKKQRVFVYSLENADVQEVAQMLRDMFDRNGTSNNRNNNNQNNALSTRSLQSQQSMGSSTGLGTTGSGSRGVGGGGISGGF